MLNKNLNIFIILVLIHVFHVVLSNYFLDTKDLIYNYYSDQLAKDKIDQLIESQQKWEWLGYTIIPVLILLRSSLVSICLSIGLFSYDPENTIKYKQLFKVALLGEFILVLVGYFKFFYFTFIVTDFTLLDIQQFYPLSYINFLNPENLEPWLIYPLQTINLFEIGYFFVLVYGLQEILKNNYWKSFEITAVSYGTGLLIWIGLVMFLTLNLS